MSDSEVPNTSRTDGKAYRVVVVLCTYNEAENLPRMVDSIRETLPVAEILVVDDNSPDGTGKWVQAQFQSNSPIHLLSRPEKQGLGTALRDAFDWALARDFDFLINLDADLSHPVAALPAFLLPCIHGECGVSIGSRYIAGGGFKNLPLHRRWMSRALNLYACRLLGLPLTDCSGSYRCYSTTALRQIDLAKLRCPGYGFLEEILVALHRAGVTFREIPIEFNARQAGRSKLSLRDAIGALSIIHQLAWNKRNHRSSGQH